MKNKILLFALGLVLFTACKKSAVDDNGGGTANVIPASSVPPAVITSFTTNFSGASQIEWQRNSDNSFTSQFNFSSQRHDARFEDNGHQSSHSVICLDAPVPQVVLDAFRQHYPTDNVYEWKLTNTGDWKPHFMRGTVKWEVTLSPSGVIIKVEHD
jgi:hypothetical protein